jgi:hypothetical protein
MTTSASWLQALLLLRGGGTRAWPNLAKALAVAVLLTGFAVPGAHAVNTTGKIARIYINATGGLFIRLAGECKSGDYFYVPSTDPRLLKWYALALTTAEAGGEITIKSDGTCPLPDNTLIDYMYRDYP